MAAPTTPSRDRVHILGMPVDRVDMAEAIRRIEAFIAERGPHLVLTADSSMLVAAQEDAEVAELFSEAALVTPDSAGVIWASGKFGKPIAAKVSGVDLVDQICRVSAIHGYRIYFLGAAEGIAEEAADKLRAKYPGCQIVGTRNGFFGLDEQEAIAREIGELKADVLFVAMGIPRQEKFIRATQHLHGAKVAMGVGGSFDVFSGRVKRAPKLFQKLKLEWLWRVMLNPSKLPKVMTLPRFVGMVLRAKKS